MKAIEDRADVLQELHGDIFPSKSPKPSAEPIRPAMPATVSEQKIIDILISDPKRARVWSGSTDGYPSQSEAELALCSWIAFFAGPDASLVDRIFRQSSLLRSKWDERHGEKLYGEMTIDKALSGKTEFFDWNRKREKSDIRLVGAGLNNCAAPALDGEETEAPASDKRIVLPQFASIADLKRDFPELRPPVIEGLLRQGETMNVISVPKIGKSWLVLDLAMSVATGGLWLGQFKCNQGRVLIIDNELHRQTIANRVPKVATARSVLIEQLQETLFVESLRGRLTDIYGMDAYFRAIEPGKFSVIVLDAFYRFLPRESDENSNADLAAIYNQIDRYAEMLKCCFVCIHHASKGVQAGKSVTDVGAGAGAQSRAADAHLILRHHEEPDAVVLEAAVRSWKPVEPMCLRWSFPVWAPAPELDPEDLRKESRRTRRVEPDAPAEPPIEWTPARFAETYVTANPQQQQLVIDRAIQVGLSEREASRLLRLALADGKVHKWAMPRTNAVYLANIEQPVTATGGEK